jgi:hypothetical protein
MRERRRAYKLARQDGARRAGDAVRRIPEVVEMMELRCPGALFSEVVRWCIGRGTVLKSGVGTTIYLLTNLTRTFSKRKSGLFNGMRRWPPAGV